jgi:hypothetical protein
MKEGAARSRLGTRPLPIELEIRQPDAAHEPVTLGGALSGACIHEPLIALPGAMEEDAATMAAGLAHTTGAELALSDAHAPPSALAVGAC